MEILAFLFVAGLALAIFLVVGAVFKPTWGLIKMVVGLTLGFTFGVLALGFGAVLLPLAAVVFAGLAVCAVVGLVIWGGCALLAAAF